jgi:hypothetical protein
VNNGEGTEILIFFSVRVSVVTHCILQAVLTFRLLICVVVVEKE